ncbi:MAG: hypothetical protein ACLQVJ_15500, partial [Syntrophobacteraceae bacterium]
RADLLSPFGAKVQTTGTRLPDEPHESPPTPILPSHFDCSARVRVDHVEDRNGANSRSKADCNPCELNSNPQLLFTGGRPDRHWRTSVTDDQTSRYF